MNFAESSAAQCTRERAQRGWVDGRDTLSSRAMGADAQRMSALMRRYAEGEDSVFDELYALAGPRLHRFCRRLAARKSEADDLFQETFLKIHRARASYMPGSDVLYWAFAIARATYIDRLRYWRRRPERLGVAGDAAEEAELLVDHRDS